LIGHCNGRGLIATADSRDILDAKKQQDVLMIT